MKQKTQRPVRRGGNVWRIAGIAVAVYLVIGLFWSISSLASSAPLKWDCPDPKNSARQIHATEKLSPACTKAPQASFGAKAASVAVGSVLWLPLVVTGGIANLTS